MRRRGFSLAELLVTLAVLGVVIGVAIPSINAGTDAAHRAHCCGNLRQMTRAAITYATSHDGRFPPGLLYGLDGQATSGDVRAWDWWRRPNGTVRPGELWSLTDGNDAQGVLMCPTAIFEDASWQGDPVTGYNYNVAFVAAEARAPTAADAGLGAWDLVAPKANLDGAMELPMASCRRSGSVALFGTGGRRGGVNKFMRSPVNAGAGYDTAYAGGQSFPNGASNVGYLDGHVATARNPRKGRHWDDLPSWLTATLEWPSNGFLSNDAAAYDPR